MWCDNISELFTPHTLSIIFCTTVLQTLPFNFDVDPVCLSVKYSMNYRTDIMKLLENIHLQLINHPDLKCLLKLIEISLIKKNVCNSISLTDNELKLAVVVVESCL